jgi:S1-C subfamily serine protease
MARATRGWWLATVLVGMAWGGVRAQEPEKDGVRPSVVKIFTTFRAPDPVRPWLKQPPREATGSGMVFAGERILTNAHVVQYASQVQVQAYESSEKLAARVVAIAPDVDLAVLELEDRAFFADHPPLELADALPRVQEAVEVYGYPAGGTDLSITKGIVSRIEFDAYQFMTRGLRIQVDAAINPGNSGGPALVGGKVIGLAFSKLGNADNIGYIIPAEEIRLFLADVEDGKYDGKPALLDEFVTLENPALRASLGLARETTGVRVQVPAFPDDPEYPLKAGDIVTRIGPHAVDNTGRVRLEDGRFLAFSYLVQRLVEDGEVPLTVLRGGTTVEVSVPVGPGRDQWLMPYLKDRYPSYFIYGPLVLSEATDEYMAILSQLPNALRALGFQGTPLVTRFGQRPAFEGERLVVVVHPMFTHPIARGYSNPFMRVVDSVNGTKVKNLRHLVELLRDLDAEFVEFRFAGVRGVETIVFRRTEALAATEEVLSDNGIRRECSDDLAPVWRAKAGE